MEEWKKYSRRDFVKTTAQAAAAISLLPSFKWYDERKEGLIKVTVLHTNDMHSHIDPFPADDPKYPGKGGMSRRAALIEEIRKKNEHVVLLDAGDVFQGTPYFNFYGGEPEFRLMTMMKYDACTMGNHDFDNGMEGFLKMLPHAGFPFLCSNYDFGDTPLHNKTFGYSVIKKGPVSIGIFGIGIELEGLVDQKNYGNTRYTDPVRISNEKALFLREEMQCDLVICLSHLGYDYKENKISDLKLAGLTENIDLIIGGHTHTFLENVTETKNKTGKKVLVTQAGWGGILLGKIDFYLEKSNKKRDKTKDITYIANGMIQVC